MGISANQQVRYSATGEQKRIAAIIIAAARAIKRMIE
jgi:hypothetical protein